MKANLSGAIKLILSIGLGAGLVYWFVNQMTPEQKAETINSFKTANYFWLIFPLMVGLTSNIVRAQRWRLLLKPLGYQPGFFITFYSVMIMFFANLFVPRLGEVTRCGILAKYEGVPLEKSIGTMVVERIIDLLSILTLLGFLMLFEYELLLNFFKDKVLNAPEKEASNPLLSYGIPVAILLAITVFAFYIIRKHGWEQLKVTAFEKFSGLWSGVKSIRYLENFGQFVLLTFLLWLCYFLMVYLTFRALPETANLSLTAGLACLIFGGFAMVATPGGIGAYPLMIRAVLLLYGINEVTGGALGTMAWGVQTTGVFLGGILSFIMLAFTAKKAEA